MPVQEGDIADADFLRAGGFAFELVGATAEAFGVVLIDHAADAAEPLGLTLRQVSQVRDLGRDEQHGRRVLAGRDAGAAADARRGVHRRFLRGLRDRDRIAVRSTAGVHADVAAGLDDPVKGAAIDDKVLEDRKRPGPPRLDPDVVAVLERSHVQVGRWRSP